MAMYYQGSAEIQSDGLHTLYLMNPNYASFSETQPNTVFLNPAAVQTLDSISVPHAPPLQAHQFVGIPLSHDPTRTSSVLHRNIWGPINPQPNTAESLSLSLSPNQTGLNKQIPTDHQDFSVGMISSSSATARHVPPSDIGFNSHVIMGSKYLKAAQQLLDEVASVREGITGQTDRAEPERRPKDKSKVVGESGVGVDTTVRGNGGKDELTTAQRQEIQMKKVKLVHMLDEVEQRYGQYHHQMEMIISSFEQSVGIGSAKSYTQLALKTISKQFRCLKDAISSQIKGLNKSLGEEDQLLIGEKLERSRLRFVDNEIRRQKAMQQLEMVQNNTWRPQRGLPERAVSVLRAWLFEHFLHPYPKDSDKQMLAKQTGLTRSQVSNWFINARVRLWKPMVEEMYQEETNNKEKNTSDHENTSKTTIEHESNSKTATMDNNHQLQIPNNQEKLILSNHQITNPSPTDHHQQSPSTVTTSRTSFAQLITSLNTENLSEKNPKRPRNFDPTPAQDNSPSSILSVEMDMRDSTKVFHQNFLSPINAANTGSVPGFGSYGINMGDLGRFNAGNISSTTNYITSNNNNNNVSLTLALPPSSGAHGNYDFGSRTETDGAGNSNRANLRINQDLGSSHTNIGYSEILHFQNRKSFPSQFLPDFMA